MAQLEQQLEGQIADARQRNGLAQMLSSLPVRLWHSPPFLPLCISQCLHDSLCLKLSFDLFCTQEEERQTALTKVLAMKPSELEARAGMQRRVTEITRGLSKEASTAFFELLPRLEVRRHHATLN